MKINEVGEGARMGTYANVVQLHFEFIIGGKRKEEKITRVLCR